MSKITFSTTEIKTLKNNSNVHRVSEKSITYTDAFKNKFMVDYLAGKLPRLIFSENGFDTDMIGIKRIEQSAYRWKKAYDEYCGQIEPAVRSFEPPFAENKASECGRESHLVKRQNNNEPMECAIPLARYFI